MKKIAFFCIPAYGHTNPTLAVVRELISRNYLVRYYSFEQFREKIEACKAEYVSLDACSSAIEGKPEDMQKVGRDMAFSIHLLAESTLAVNETVLSSLRKYQPDLIIADSMAVWGRMAALKLNIPYITSMTTFAFNKDSAKIMKGSGPSMIGLLKAIPSMNRDVKALRQAGYPVKNFLDLISASPDARTIVYTSKQFQPSSESFGDQYAFVGPSIALPPVESQTKCIYVSLGTVNNQNLEFFRNCLMALKEIAKPAIVSIGRNIRIEDLGEIPANVQTLPFTNQLEILQHCSVFLSHCGMNSVSESLYCGVPLVLYPQTAEQTGVARRAEQVHAGIMLESDTPEAIRKALETVMSDTAYSEAAKAIGDGFRDAGGAAAAVDFVDRTLAQTN